MPACAAPAQAGVAFAQVVGPLRDAGQVRLRLCGKQARGLSWASAIAPTKRCPCGPQASAAEQGASKLNSTATPPTLRNAGFGRNHFETNIEIPDKERAMPAE
jgi:hypothetical protein